MMFEEHFTSEFMEGNGLKDTLVIRYDDQNDIMSSGATRLYKNYQNAPIAAYKYNSIKRQNKNPAIQKGHCSLKRLCQRTARSTSCF